jgi:serine/threonine protein kinase
MKVLLNQCSSERLGRFRNEIDFLLGPGQRPGVVPILDHDLSGAGKVWYVMPLAVPIRTALGAGPPPERVVEAMSAIAGTLAGLAEEGISHRDVKPDNLLCLNGVWSVGDFGLVKYPAGQALTEHGRKLGPTDFMAPEMRESPDTADPESADVYSIAKTLWVLLAGVNLPFPGQHRADDDICCLTARLDYRWAPHLDLLIERCTVHEPRRRPRMREVADELTAMVEPTTETTVMEGTEDLERRIAAMTERHRRRDEDREAFNNRVTRAWHQLVEEVAQPAYQELADRLPNFDTRYPVEVAMPRSLVTPPSVSLDSEIWGGMIIAPGEAGVRIDLGVALRVHDDAGRSTIAAVVEVHRHNQGRGHSVSILEHMAETRLGSAKFESTLVEIRNAYAACLPETLARLADALDAERHLAAKFH